mgnify:CR=1 FL=1|tara:strand:+ start:7428 stop:8621 length:1194 start_codon:yes stop_codon:yes gene_type:complete
MSYDWPLMENTIEPKQKQVMIDFLVDSDRFTNGKKVLEFEQKWSEWQGCNHSVFVNSGSTANMLLLWAIKNEYFKNKKMVVLTPACTWATNISTMIQFGIEFVVADNDLFDFGISEKSLIEAKNNFEEINVIFVTHLLGSPTNVELIKKHFPKAMIIEDCCESHGATYKNNKVGNLGIGSTFSFYYGHHMTTIEGGMVCTNDDKLYNILRMMRSHGMSRESLDTEYKNNLIKNNPKIDSKFLFPYSGFNFRNTEINAVLGIEQLKKLDNYIEIRKRNLKIFDTILEKHNNLFFRFNMEGNSAMVLPFICKSPQIKNLLMDIFEENKIETRPFLIGNLLKQPFVSAFDVKNTITENADYLHDCGFYIGNNHKITPTMLETLENIINLIYDKKNWREIL